MHPPFLAIMDEIRQGLSWLFQTASKATCLVSGTGHAGWSLFLSFFLSLFPLASSFSLTSLSFFSFLSLFITSHPHHLHNNLGMEAVVANLLEPGDSILVGTSGIWGERVADMSSRFGAKVSQLTPDAVSGGSIPVPKIVAAIEDQKPTVVFLVQGESSTGVHQNLSPAIGKACRAAGSLLVVDSVASLGGVPFYADEWLVDAGYAGSQKVLSAPPGAAPLFFGERALEKLARRKTPPATYNLDLNLVGTYWGWFLPEKPRSYHHTGMVSMWYAMREALAVLKEENGGKLEVTWQRHRAMAERLWAGLSELGLKPFAASPGDALATVNTIVVPQGVDWAALCAHALSEYHLEIAGGLGPTAGKVWRVGVMGRNACPECVDLVIAAFKSGLAAQRWKKE